MAGRIKQKLAVLLERAFKAEGIAVTVDPDELFDVKGFHRSSNHGMNDTFRWEGSAHREGSDLLISLHSYTPMTNITRSGNAVLTQDHRGVMTYDVSDAEGN